MSESGFDIRKKAEELKTDDSFSSNNDLDGNDGASENTASPQADEDDGDDEPEIAEWVVTFGDMMTLLLCFFILLFAMSDVKVDKIKAAVQSFENSGFGVQNVKEFGKRLGLDIIMHPDDNSAPKEVDELGANKNKIEDIEGKMTDFVMKNKLGGFVSVAVNERGAVISISDLILFKPGSAEIEPEAKPILKKTTALLKQFDYNIRIEGHTNKMEPLLKKFPSEWELSAAQASKIAQYFRDQGINSTRLYPEGFAGYRPKVGSGDLKQMKKNRRVEVIFLRESELAKQRNLEGL